MKIFGKSQSIDEKNSDVLGGDYVTYRVVDKSGNVVYEGKAKGGKFNDSIKWNRSRLKKGTKPKYHTILSREYAEQEVRDSERY